MVYRWLVVVILIVLLDSVGALNWLRTSVVWSLTPLLNSANYIVARQERMLRFGQQLHLSARQNLDLQRQIAELRVAADKVELVQAENLELRKQLELDVARSVMMIPAKVVMRDGETWRVSLTESVLVGSMVIGDGRVIAVVTGAEGYVGEVSVVGSKGMGQIEVRSTNGRGSLGVVMRDGSGLWIEKVSKEMVVQVGELLVTVGDGKRILPDYPVANVAQVDAPEAAVYQSLRLGEYHEALVGDTVWIVGEPEL